MTETTDTKIHKLVIDEAYQDAALTRIRKMVSGNKLEAEDVKMLSFEGEVLQFQAEIIADIAMIVNKRTSYGRMQGSYVTESEAASRDKMNKEYLALRNEATTIKQVRDIITALPNKGFAKGGMKIPLTFWRKSFVNYQPCTDCKSAGHIRCQRCSGAGSQNCGRCYGSGYCACHTCNGSTTIMDSQRGRIPCPMCNGYGKVSCPPCRQSGKVECATCAGKGNIKCSTCNGSAWLSLIQEMTLEAHTKFDYPRQNLPENVVAMIEKDKERLAQYALINVLPPEVESLVNKSDEEKAKEKLKAEEEKYFRILVLYSVVLPYSNMTFEIKGKTYYAFLFGTKGELVHASTFLDELLAEPQRKLQDAAEGRGHVKDNLKAAAAYRSAREAILLTSKLSQAKAVKELRKANAIGLSAKKAQSIISFTEIGLRNLTRRSRYIGLALGQITSLCLYAGYLLTPLRKMMLQALPTTIPDFATDFAVFALTSYLGAIAIQITAGTSLKNNLKDIMPEGTEISSGIKLGQEGWLHYAGCVILAAASIEASRHFGQPPYWYLQILSNIL